MGPSSSRGRQPRGFNLAVAVCKPRRSDERGFVDNPDPASVSLDHARLLQRPDRPVHMHLGQPKGITDIGLRQRQVEGIDDPPAVTRSRAMMSSNSVDSRSLAPIRPIVVSRSLIATFSAAAIA